MVRLRPMLNGIESAKLKVKRAVEHIETLQGRAREYASDDTNLVVEESDGAKKLRSLTNLRVGKLPIARFSL